MNESNANILQIAQKKKSIAAVAFTYGSYRPCRYVQLLRISDLPSITWWLQETNHWPGSVSGTINVMLPVFSMEAAVI